jgi:hypothetical protein
LSRNLTGHPPRQSVDMKTIRRLAILFGLIVLALIVWDLCCPGVYQRRSADIRVGDDKARVREIMGAPTGTFTLSDGGFVTWLMGIPSEEWTYGRTLEWQAPVTRDYPWVRLPIRLELFAHHSGDVVVVFGARGKVVRVETPK